MVHQVVTAVDIPVIGVGGIMEYTDALEFLIAGARAIEVGTASFVNPRVTLNILEGISKFCQEREIANIDALIGSLQTTSR
jgi:dihydroorotate dehydrogenase (NAD+) catalytic subunit